MRTSFLARQAVRRGTIAFWVTASLLLAACGGAARGPAYAPPSGWRDISPPTTDPLGAFAVSPDVPGLIVACLGDIGGDRTSTAPLGPATLWRTHDGGAHWDRVETATSFTAGCSLTFPAGGQGTLFARSSLGDADLLVSHDAGNTWASIGPDQSRNGGPRPRSFDLLAQGVYRDGMLYVTGQGAPFSVSRNDGRTWETLEHAPADSNQQDGGMQQTWGLLAGGTSGEWLRLTTPPLAPTATDAPVRLERSDNDGATWHIVSTVAVPGATGRPLFASLAAADGRPGRLCVGFTVEVLLPQPTRTVGMGQTGARLAARMGPPYRPPRAVALMASDDGGRTWSGGTVSRTDAAGGDLVPPGVMVREDGTCLLATATQIFGAPTDDDTTTVWSLSPGAASPAHLSNYRGQITTYAALQNDPDGHERLVTVTFTRHDSGVVVCRGDVCPPRPKGEPQHLLWASAR